MEAKALNLGDPCPRCEGSIRPVRVPTAAQYAKAYDKENPTSLPEGCDTASPDFRAEHGDLHRCVLCGYQARFIAPAEPEAPAAAVEAAPVA